MRDVRLSSLVFALAAIWTFFALSSPAFLGARNVAMLAIELAITSVLALGMLLVLLPGQIDLSVGSGVGLCGGVASVLVFQHGLPAPLAMTIALVATVALSATMGTAIVRAKLPAFIVTLGGLLVFKGLFWLVIRNATIPVARGNEENAYSMLTTYFFPRSVGFALIGLAVVVYGYFRRGKDKELTFLELFVVAQAALLLALVLDRFRGLPLSFVLLVLAAAVVHVVTAHTRFGRHLYAIGDNEAAARLSGIPIARTVITAYALLGVIVALTGLLQTAYAGASTTTVGDLMELDAIAACVIGGTSLRGGRGSVFGVLVGALIMTSLLNGMTLLAVAPELKLIARGSVLLLAVWLDVAMARRAAA